VSDNVTLQVAGGTASIPLPPKASLTEHSSSSLPGDDNKIEKSAKDFESILLGSWLQQAEQSFAKLPGSDDDADADAGKEQFQGMAMQSLGISMTASGGIGIAKMISKELHKAEKGLKGDEANTSSGRTDKVE
jgi:Rod binding domain-containing protein